jgi:hypothetical protein
MHQRGGVERVAVGFAGHLGRRQLAEFGVDLWE